MAREVSDRVVITLLIVAVVISVLGAYAIYDYSTSYRPNDVSGYASNDISTGQVVLNVIDKNTGVGET